MFGKKKTTTPTINATAVMQLNDSNIEFLKAIQMKHLDSIPEGATHVAFLEDGDACFLNHFEPGRVADSFIPALPTMRVTTYYTNIPIQFEE